MAFFPVFLSVIYVVKNQASQLEEILSVATTQLSSLVSDYELIVVDNASQDGSAAILKTMTGENGLPNLQVYVLTKEVDFDTASWAGLENALGDFVAVIDPLSDNIAFLPEMLEAASRGVEVVFAKNQQTPQESIAYRFSYKIFNKLFKAFNEIQLTEEASRYRILNKRVINFILQHTHPPLIYRHLPASSGGFSRITLSYSGTPPAPKPKKLIEGIDRGIRLLVSTTRTPMRIVTFLSLFGAIANVIYSIYIVIIAIFKTDVEPGWISLSLQQSGMFFLISLVLLVLGEYILHTINLSDEGPLYHVGQEFNSAKLTRYQKLNIEESSH